MTVVKIVSRLLLSTALCTVLVALGFVWLGVVEHRLYGDHEWPS